MGSYIVYRRGVIEQTIVVQDAKSKADAIRQADSFVGVEPDHDFKNPPVFSAHHGVVRWYHPGTWIVEAEEDTSVDAKDSEQ